MSLRISEHAAASPDMSDAAFAELVEDIKRRGQLVPIWRCGDEIIDGRKRFRACTLLGIEPTFVDAAKDQDSEALSYSLNILRTHYSASQRAILAAKRATATQADGPARRGQAEEGYSYPSSLKTLAEVAGEAGVGRAYLVKAKRLRRESSPATIAAIEAGTLTVRAATRALVPAQRAPAPEASTRSRSPVSGYHRSPRRPLAGRMDRALDQLDNALGALDDFSQEPEAPQHPDRGTWFTRLTGAKGELTKLIAHITTRGRSTA